MDTHVLTEYFNLYSVHLYTCTHAWNTITKIPDECRFTSSRYKAISKYNVSLVFRFKEFIKTSEEISATYLINVLGYILCIRVFVRVVRCMRKLRTPMTFSIDTCYGGCWSVKAVYMSTLLCLSQCMKLM